VGGKASVFIVCLKQFFLGPTKFWGATVFSIPPVVMDLSWGYLWWSKFYQSNYQKRWKTVQCSLCQLS